MLKMVDQSSNFVIWIDFEDFGQLKNILLLNKGTKVHIFIFHVLEWKMVRIWVLFYMFKI